MSCGYDLQDRKSYFFKPFFFLCVCACARARLAALEWLNGGDDLVPWTSQPPNELVPSMVAWQKVIVSSFCLARSNCATQTKIWIGQTKCTDCIFMASVWADAHQLWTLILVPYTSNDPVNWCPQWCFDKKSSFNHFMILVQITVQFRLLHAHTYTDYINTIMFNPHL